MYTSSPLTVTARVTPYPTGGGLGGIGGLPNPAHISQWPRPHPLHPAGLEAKSIICTRDLQPGHTRRHDDMVPVLQTGTGGGGL